MRTVDLKTIALAVVATVALMVVAMAFDAGIGFFYAAFAAGFAIIVIRSLDSLEDR